MAEDIEKLPKWAQSRMRVLEMRLSEAIDKLEDLNEDGNVLIDPYSHNPRRAKSGTSVKFIPEQDARWEERMYYIACMHDDGILEVQAAQAIDIRPRASNLIYVDCLAPDERERVRWAQAKERSS